MSQIEELQGRIAAALDRIGKGLDKQGDSAVDPSEFAALKQELEEERLVLAQIRERNKVLKARRMRLEAKLVHLQQVMADSAKKFDTELQALRQANTQLRENNTKLREANQAGVAEPHLINKSMMAELDGVRAAQAADKAEAEAVLAALKDAVGSVAANDETEEA